MAGAVYQGRPQSVFPHTLAKNIVATFLSVVTTNRMYVVLICSWNTCTTEHTVMCSVGVLFPFFLHRVFICPCHHFSNGRVRLPLHTARLANRRRCGGASALLQGGREAGREPGDPPVVEEQPHGGGRWSGGPGPNSTVCRGQPQAQGPSARSADHCCFRRGSGLSGWGPGRGNEALGLEWKAPCISHWLPPGGAAPRGLLPKPPPPRRCAPVWGVR